jgi:hypothetical protein
VRLSSERWSVDPTCCVTWGASGKITLTRHDGTHSCSLRITAGHAHSQQLNTGYNGGQQIEARPRPSEMSDPLLCVQRLMWYVCVCNVDGLGPRRCGIGVEILFMSSQAPPSPLKSSLTAYRLNTEAIYNWDRNKWNESRDRVAGRRRRVEWTHLFSCSILKRRWLVIGYWAGSSFETDSYFVSWDHRSGSSRGWGPSGEGYWCKFVMHMHEIALRYVPCEAAILLSATTSQLMNICIHQRVFSIRSIYSTTPSKVWPSS